MRNGGGRVERLAPSTGRDRVVLLIACAAQFMVILDVSVVNVALPSIGHDLHVDAVGLQWVPNAYVLTFAGFLLVGGRTADLFGRRRAYLAGLGLFVAASALGGSAQGAAWLTAARAVQGVGSALLSPATLTIIVTTFSGQRLARAVGVWSAVGSAGGAIGVFLGGVLTSELGWRWILFINIPIGVAAGSVALATLSELRRPTAARRPDIPGAMTVTAGLALFAYAIVTTDRYPWASAHTLGCLGGAIVLLAVFLVVQVRSESPLLPLRLFRSRFTTGAVVIVLMLGSWSFPAWYFYSLYLQDVVGYSPIRTGAAFVPMGIVLAFGAQLSSRKLLVRLGLRRTVQLAIAVVFGGYVWLSRLTPGDRYWGIFGGAMLASLGIGLVFTPLVAAGTGGVDSSEAGLASGLLNTARQVGGSIGLAGLATVAAARTHLLERTGHAPAVALTAGFARAFTVVAGVAVLAMAFTAVLPKRVTRPVVPGTDRSNVAGPAEAVEADGAREVRVR